MELNNKDSNDSSENGILLQSLRSGPGKSGPESEFRNLEGTVVLDKYTLFANMNRQSGEAEIYLCHDRENNRYAAKIYKRTDAVKPEVLRRLARLKSSNIVPIIDYGDFRGYPCVILPYFMNGSLAGKTFDAGILKKIIIPNVCSGLKYLHNHGIIHKDLNPSNLMISDDGKQILIIDFGISSAMSANKSIIITKTGMSPEYCAPETFSNIWLPESDYYAFGITLYELFKGNTPFAQSEKEAHSESNRDLAAFASVQKIPFDDDFPPELKKLILGLTFRDLSHRNEPGNPNRRWTYTEIEKWCEGEDLPVPDEGAGSAGKKVRGRRKNSKSSEVSPEDNGEIRTLEFSRPYHFYSQDESTVTIGNMADLISELQVNWEEGKKHIGRGLVAEFFKSLNLQQYASLVMDCADAGVTDVAYLRLLLKLQEDQKLPRLLYWKGVHYENPGKLCAEILKNAEHNKIADHNLIGSADEIYSLLACWYKCIHLNETADLINNYFRTVSSRLYGDERIDFVTLCSILTCKTDFSCQIYKPQNKDELMELISDESICLGLIDTGSVADFSRLFAGSQRKDYAGIEDWNTSNALDMSHMFEGARHFNNMIGNWDVSRVTDFSYMFHNAEIFNQPMTGKNAEFCSCRRGISEWNTSSALTMRGMFQGARSFNQPIGSWNISQVKDLAHMFHGADFFNQTLDDWDTSNVTDMSFLFCGANSFNQPIGSWNTSKAELMNDLFNGASAFNQNIGGWDTSSVTCTSGMFAGASGFRHSIEKWNLSAVTNKNLMYWNADAFRNSEKMWDCSGLKDTSFYWHGEKYGNIDALCSRIFEKSNSSRVLENELIASKEQFYELLNYWFKSRKNEQILNLISGFRAAAPKQKYSDELSEVLTMCSRIAEIIPFSYKIYFPKNRIDLIRLVDDPSVHLGFIETRDVTDFSELFKNTSRRDFAGVEDWDTSNVTDMSFMFKAAEYFNQPIGRWDTSKVVNMSGMFDEAKNFNQPIGNWKVDSVTDMSFMFRSAEAFNQPLEKWNTANVTTMRCMFCRASSFNQPVGNWKLDNVTDMSFMFYNARYFNCPVGEWNISKVTDLSFMFYHAKYFNQPIGGWDTSRVTNMGSMFCEASAFNQPIGGWNTSNVTNMSEMFKEAHAFNYPLDNWDTSQVTDFSFMFSSTRYFNQPLNHWNTSNVTDMSNMFNYAYAFNQPLDHWDTSCVTDMSGMFHEAENFNQDINCWDVSGVTDFNHMFSGAKSFNSPLDRWDTSAACNMNYMFYEAYSFNQPIDCWNTEKVETMEKMLSRARSFNQDVDFGLVRHESRSPVKIIISRILRFFRKRKTRY